MPRIINAYDGNSALGKSLGDLGEAIFGDGAKNEVYRQKAIESKRGNDNAEPFAAAVRDGRKNDVAYYGALGNHTGADTGAFNLVSRTNHAAGLDDPAVALAQLGNGGTAQGTFAGQGRALANDRATNAATNATSERNNIRNNAETHYGTDRGYASSTENSIRSSDASRDVARINGENQHNTQVDIANRTPVRTEVSPGVFEYHPQSEVNSQHLRPVVSPEDVKGGVLAGVIRRAGENANPASPSPFSPNASPFKWSNGAPQPAAAAPAARPGTVNVGAYGQMTPQEAQMLGVPRQAMIHPQTGQTGYSYNNGTTLADGSSASGFIPSTDEAVLAREKDNNVIKSISTPLAQLPTGMPQYAADVYAASGPGGIAQHELNAMSGAVGGGQVGADTNSARNNVIQTNNQARGLYSSAPGAHAAVYREKNAAAELPDASGYFGSPGINAEQQRQRAIEEIAHFRGMIEAVQKQAQDPLLSPADREKMAQWLYPATNLYNKMITVQAPTAGAQPAAAPAQAAPTAGAQPAAPAAKPPTVTQNGHTYHLQPDGSYQ